MDIYQIVEAIIDKVGMEDREVKEVLEVICNNYDAAFLSWIRENVTVQTYNTMGESIETIDWK